MSNDENTSIKELGFKSSIIKKFIGCTSFCVAAALLFISLNSTEAMAQFVCDPPCTVGQLCAPSNTCIDVPTECSTDADCTAPATCMRNLCIFIPEQDECVIDSDCRIGEVCVTNQCIDLGGGGLPDCNDNNPCTLDRLESTCTIACAPGTSCCSTFCTHTSTNQGSSCDDGNACTTGTVCSSGSCGGGQQIVCDNGLFCDGAETCNTTAGCLAGTPPVINDGVSCTTDSCDEASDTITHTPNNSICDNGQYCDGAETCDTALDCQAGTAPSLNDGVSCTDDICTEIDGVTHIANNANCDNGQFCDGSETCDAALDCQAGTALDVDDGVGCTDDFCDEENDVIQHAANHSLCDNGLFCDGIGACDPIQDCVFTAPPIIGDGVACTDDSCDEANNVVVNIPNNANCDNGLFCDGAETCDASQGCLAGTPPTVDDGVSCTDDSCDENNDIVVNAANDANCDNGQFCDGSETCDAAQGCQDGTAPVTDDGIACTDDSCDEANDVVVNTANNANCDNGLYCDGEETCDAAQGCQDGTAPDTDDGVACTDDSCDEDNDIVLNLANDANCDNGQFCDGEETCDAALDCQDGTAPDTDDGVACTEDSCDEESDIVLNEPNDSLCDNGLYCDGEETCHATLDCQDGTAPGTDDGVACTDDSCDEDNDIVVNTANDANCDNAIFCDGVETCDAALGCQTDDIPPTGEVCGEDPTGICIDLACVFDGMITIVKMADPNDGTDFLFGCTDSSGAACSSIGDASGMFTLDDEPVDTDGVPDSETFTEVLAGVYSIQEVIPPGWESADIICENDDDEGTVIDLEMAEAMIDLDPGEDITCTFFNYDAPVTIENVNNGADYLLMRNKNRIFISGATPDKKVYLIWGFSEGAFTVGGSLCPGTQLGIKQPKVLANFMPDSEGVAEGLFYIPYMGQYLAYFQAVDSGNCMAGDVMSFPIIDN